jgi:nucleotide-binding universal stress UspA family protein
MITTLVVALDLASDGDRALPVVRALAELGVVDVELLTVSTPNLADDVDRVELSRRATANGWPAHSYVVLHGYNPAEAIVDHLDRRDSSLLVMSTSAKRPIVGHFLGSVSERVLRVIDHPVLLVGPHVPPSFQWSCPTPIVCVDDADVTMEAVPTIAAWMQTFHSGSPWIVEVVPAATGGTPPDSVESSHAQRLAGAFSTHGINASWDVLHGGAPEDCLDMFADQFPEPMFITTSTRWTDGHLHWKSVTRQLVQRSPRPVLVVPAPRHRAVAPTGSQSTNASPR